MIGCILFGGLAAMGIAAFARRRQLAWLHYQHHFRDPFHHGHWHGGGHRFGGAAGMGGACGGANRWDDPRAFDDPSGAGGDDGESFTAAGGPWFVLRRFLRRLETTPTQERAIRAAVNEFREAAKPLRAEGRRSRADLATAMRRSSLDEVVLGEMFARHDRAAEELRRAFVGLLAKLHEILDDIQRERFGTLIEKGFRRHPFGGGEPFGATA